MSRQEKNILDFKKYFTQKMTLSKLKFRDDNFYMVTFTKKNVMVARK